MVPSFCYQANKILFGSALQSSIRGYPELHFPPEFLASAAGNFVICSHFVLVGMQLKSGDDSALTTQFRRYSYQIYYNIKIKYISVFKIKVLRQLNLI
jgi:hypothetical protein